LQQDLLLLREFKVEYAPKFYVYKDSVAIFSIGLTGTLDVFMILCWEVKARRGIETLYGFKIMAEILAELTRRYAGEVREVRSVNVVSRT
jgi:hypothetical protein